MEELGNLLIKHCKSIIKSLVSSDIHFSIVCEVKNVSFNPPLPEDITSGFMPIISFILAGYTFQSIKILDDKISFEAGFGKDNMGSILEINFSNIIQIMFHNEENLKNAVIFVNILSDYNDDEEKNNNNYNNNENNDNNAVKESEDELLNSSRLAILSNPNNKQKGKK